MQPTRRRWLPLAVLAAVAICSGAIAVVATSNGPVITPDGVVYLATADSMRHGRGVVVPFTSYTDVFDDELIAADGAISAPLSDFPPGFPTLVAGVSRLSGAEPVAAARWSNIVLLTINSFLIGLVTLLLAGASRWWWACAAQVVALFGSIVFPGIPGLLFIHVAVLAEPAMLACTLVAIFCALTLTRRWSTPLLVVATAAAGAAMLFRFIGVAAIVTVMYAAVRHTPGRPAKRWVVALVVLVAGSAPTALRQIAAPDGRSVQGRAIELVEWQAAATELGTGVAMLVAPFTLPAVASFTLGAVAAACLAYACLSRGHGAPIAHHRNSDAQLLAVFAVTYLGVLVLTRLVVDRWVPLQGRLLVPVMVVLVIACAGLGRPGRRRTLAFALAGLIVAVPGVLGTVHWVPTLGAGRTHDLTAPATAALADVPDDVVVVTDQPDRIHLATGRAVMMVPCRDLYFSGAENQGFEHELDRLLQLVRDGRAVVLLDGGPGSDRHCFDRADADAADLVAASEWPFGVLYR